MLVRGIDRRYQTYSLSSKVRYSERRVGSHAWAMHGTTCKSYSEHHPKRILIVVMIWMGFGHCIDVKKTE